jgi:hypothetical protein
MRAKTEARDAPSVAAASSILGSTASIARRMARTISGKPMTIAASTAPVHLNASVRPMVASAAPAGAVGENSTSST